MVALLVGSEKWQTLREALTHTNTVEARLGVLLHDTSTALTADEHAALSLALRVILRTRSRLVTALGEATNSNGSGI